MRKRVTETRDLRECINVSFSSSRRRENERTFARAGEAELPARLEGTRRSAAVAGARGGGGGGGAARDLAKGATLAEARRGGGYEVSGSAR